MAILITVILTLIFETILAAFVAARAWDYRPARLFVLVVAVLALLNSFPLARSLAVEPAAAYAVRVVLYLGVGMFVLTLLWLLSALFMPQWWEGRRPIAWISLPYLLVLAFLALDLGARTGLVVDGLILVDGAYRVRLVSPGAPLVFALLTAGFAVHLVLLGLTFRRGGEARVTVGLLGLSVLLIGLLVWLLERVRVHEALEGLLRTLPFLLTLSYAVLRTRLFTPTRLALDQAMQAMDDMVAVVGGDDVIAYANRAARLRGLQPGLTLAAALAGAAMRHAEAERLGQAARTDAAFSTAIALGDRQLQVSFSPIRDASGRQSTLLLGFDSTEQELRSRQLMHERAELARAAARLEEARRARTQLADAAQALALPLIPVLDGVLVAPLTGAFDLARSDELCARLWQGVEQARARLVLLDMTGLPLLDHAGAAALVRAVRGLELLGARGVLVGVRPETAEALVALGAPLDRLASAATLQQAIRRSLSRSQDASPGRA